MAKMGRESNKTIGMRGLFLKMGWIKKYIACSFSFGNHVVLDISGMKFWRTYF
jgi:hypothetical protein